MSFCMHFFSVCALFLVFLSVLSSLCLQYVYMLMCFYTICAAINWSWIQIYFVSKCSQLAMDSCQSGVVVVLFTCVHAFASVLRIL